MKTKTYYPPKQKVNEKFAIPYKNGKIIEHGNGYYAYPPSNNPDNYTYCYSIKQAMLKIDNYLKSIGKY